jgi:hypothetical protein
MALFTQLPLLTQRFSNRGGRVYWSGRCADCESTGVVDFDGEQCLGWNEFFNGEYLCVFDIRRAVRILGAICGFSDDCRGAIFVKNPVEKERLSIAAMVKKSGFRLPRW